MGGADRACVREKERRRPIPWDSVCSGDGTFKPVDELRQLYGAEGIDGSAPVITYCRIGERSSHSWFVLTYLLGFESVTNYDGSWTEWGNLVGAPIEKGAVGLWTPVFAGIPRGGVAVSADGRWAVSASGDCAIKVWDPKAGACIATFTCDGAALCCSFAGIHRIIAGDAAGRVHFLSLELGDGK